ncbi:hypothetical protein CsSME_00038393 [Camellia sinensis var. sinensis]
MEVLISSEEEGDQKEIASTTTETTDKIVFPKLKELYLRGLPSFIALCKAVNGIELLQLNQLILCEIPKLNSFCNSSDSNYDSIQPLFNQVIVMAVITGWWQQRWTRKTKRQWQQDELQRRVVMAVTTEMKEEEGECRQQR